MKLSQLEAVRKAADDGALQDMPREDLEAFAAALLDELIEIVSVVESAGRMRALLENSSDLHSGHRRTKLH